MVVPSHYTMMKDCPEMKPFNLTSNQSVVPTTTAAAAVTTFGGGGDDDIMLENENEMILENPDVGEEANTIEDIIDQNTCSDGSRIVGGYTKVVDLMLEKHGRMKNSGGGSSSKMIIIDSFDGAQTSNQVRNEIDSTVVVPNENTSKSKSVTNVISYSSILHSPCLINSEDCKAGSSKNIITWQQMNGKESSERVLKSVRPHYSSKRKFMETNGNSTKFASYDMHDGKMLYLLTQHGLWNRKHHPFLLCKCGRGEGVQKENHVCTIIKNEQQKKYYKRSKKKWKKDMNENIYDVGEHLKWCDQYNYGISHFGIDPDLLNRDMIRMDTFHLKCAITRGMMAFLRLYLDANLPIEVKYQFFGELKNFWNSYHIHVWDSKRNFSSFKGNELALYVANSEAISTFIKSTISETDLQKDVVESLGLWHKIFGFLGITYIKDDEKYIKSMEDNEKHIERLYQIMGNSALTRPGDSSKGQKETFYWHALRYYLPWMIRDTYETHSLGIGIFTMQGFERRNKETKKIYQQRCNNRGDTMTANLKKSWALFHHDMED